MNLARRTLGISGSPQRSLLETFGAFLQFVLYFLAGEFRYGAARWQTVCRISA